MKENNCPIKDCFCKCETKQELQEWSFRVIQRHVCEERKKEYKDIDFERFYWFVCHMIDGYAEISIDMPEVLE